MEIISHQVIHDAPNAPTGITCCLCQKILSDPVTLPCLDSFCLKCLDSYQLSPTPACPRCQTTFFIPKEGLSSMPYNRFTQKVLMLHRILNQDADDKFCDICCPNRPADDSTTVHTSLAEKYCVECQQKYCMNCLAYHARMKCTSFHQVIELGIESSHRVEQMQKEKDQFCPTHSAEQIVQCLSCDVLVCPLCHEQNHLTHQCQLFRDDIKLHTKLEINVKKQLLIDSLKNRQNTIKQVENELSTRASEIFNIRQSVAQKVVELKQAIDNCEQQLRQELDNYHAVNVSSLQVDVEKNTTVVSSMMKLERFMQELTDKGSDCDLVQFNATLCRRSDNLLNASFMQNSIDELRLLFLPSDINMHANNLIGGLISTSVGHAAEVNTSSIQGINYAQVGKYEAQPEPVNIAEQQLSSSVIVSDTGIFNISTEPKTDATKLTDFTNKSKIIHIIDVPGGSWRIREITVLGNEIFLILHEDGVEVYDIKTYKWKHHLSVQRAKGLSSIVACQHNNCLYIAGRERKGTIYRCCPGRSTKYFEVLNKWSVKLGLPRLFVTSCDSLLPILSVSITSSYSLLVTLSEWKSVHEYASDGRRLREISLDSSIEELHHCLQLSNDQFVVSHGKGITSRVCIVDAGGRIVHSYCGRQSSDIGRMDVHPYFGRHNSDIGLMDVPNIVVDGHGNVMVFDNFNHRVELLSPTLSHIGYLQIPEHKRINVSALHFDQLNNRLYVCVCLSGFGKRVFVLSADISS